MKRRCGVLSVLGLISLLSLVGCGGGGGRTSALGAAGTAWSGSPASAQVHPHQATVSDARAAGRRACRGVNPLEIAQRYERAAVASGVSKKFAALAADPTASMRSSAGYPRLVAAIYVGTLPASQRAQAAAGCAEELASR